MPKHPLIPPVCRLLAGAIALTLAAVPALAAPPAAAGEPPGSGPFLSGYLDQAHKTAEANRYLVKADELVTPAANMEPRMVHCDQLAATVSKLADGGYCAPAIPAQVLAQCPDVTLPAASDCKRPNILIFLVDDMGWSDFGPYGGGVAVGAATPSVDKIASRGLVLTSTYAQPSCSPTRATIHTGQLPVHHGVLSPPMYGAPGGLTRESFPLPLILKRQGYVTRGAGKWHLGNGTDNLPSSLGYDEFLGFLNVSDMYSEWRDHYYNPEVRWDGERTEFMQQNQFNHYLVLDKAGKGCANLGEIVLPEEAAVGNQGEEDWGFGGPCKAPETPREKVSIGELDQIWADYSVKFIEDSKDSDQPWFLYHATRGCHFDNYPREDFQRASYARTVYGDCTVEIDEVFGRLMSALEATGQDKDTLVFFTSDNGPEAEIPPHGHTPFRGAKGDTWEGGMRVPGIAYWPGMIEGGQRSDGLFDLADLYSTAISLAGFDYSTDQQEADRYLYGIDQSSFLLAEGAQSNRRSVLYWYLTNFAAVRMDEFKAHKMTTVPVGLDRGNLGGFSGVNLPSSYLLMFNLMVDPQEQDNVMIRHLWNNSLFGEEFRRFYCVLTQFEPYLPTKQAQNILADDEIWLLEANSGFRENGCKQPSS
jgi:arylsulfatase